ncbi:hypothetical protein [Diaphorobacter sp. J5-51]|uniref:hypothetical protein n=1 Tax=Diaphorobacter sp. J5-51 TaxID=680496 RepID=UPI0012F7BC49|nr:hypothetical protein [Diaphorobacter sp. J5-51]
MTTPTYTHAENAAFLHDLAGTLERIGGQAKNIERLHDLAAREAEQDPEYLAYVNARVSAALENPGQLHTLEEARSIVRSWRSTK